MCVQILSALPLKSISVCRSGIVVESPSKATSLHIQILLVVRHMHDLGMELKYWSHYSQHCIYIQTQVAQGPKGVFSDHMVLNEGVPVNFTSGTSNSRRLYAVSKHILRWGNSEWHPGCFPHRQYGSGLSSVFRDNPECTSYEHPGGWLSC